MFGSVAAFVTSPARPGSGSFRLRLAWRSSLLLVALTAATAAYAQAPGFSKEFVPNVMGVGGISTLIFTIDNTGSGLAASALDFTDNLPAGVLVASPANASTTCTGGALTATAGTGVINYTGGSVSAMVTCTVQVDVTAATIDVFHNITGDLTSSLGNSGTTFAFLATQEAPEFSKEFTPEVIAVGGTSTLTFTIDNFSSLNPSGSVDFTDNLPAGVVVATPPNDSTTCNGGTLTAVAGSGTISYTGGEVGGEDECFVIVDVTGTVPGAHVNVSGDLTSATGNSGSATDTLTVEPPPTFAKAFAPDPIGTGGVSTLTFTIDNTASAFAASALDFTDNLPAGVEVASPANASSTCTAGIVGAAPGSSTIVYTGGLVAAGASCTLDVDVTATSVGSHVNTTGDLTSSLGNSGTATDTLTVEPPPTFAKAFAPGSIEVGGVSVLTFTIDNSASALAASALDFTDVLPAGVEVASPANESTTCTGGTLTATPGTGTITYTGGSVAAGASCTLDVDVTATASGSHVNTTGDLTSSLGNSGPAPDTLTVTVPVPVMAMPWLGALAAALALLAGWHVLGRSVRRPLS